MVRASPDLVGEPCDQLTVALEKPLGETFELGRRRRQRAGLLESAHGLPGVGLRPLSRPSVCRARLKGPLKGHDFG